VRRTLTVLGPWEPLEARAEVLEGPLVEEAED
jgi:hypothetical protein